MGVGQDNDIDTEPRVGWRDRHRRLGVEDERHAHTGEREAQKAGSSSHDDECWKNNWKAELS